MKAQIFPDIQYRLVNRVNPVIKEPGKLFVGPIVAYRGEITFERLCQMVSERSTATDSDVEAVLQALLTNAGYMLLNSEAVDLGKLGYLTNAMRTDLVEDPEQYTHANIRGAHVVFRPGVKLRKLAKQVTLTRVK